MKNEVTLITAFFDIGRKDFTQYPRSNNEYLEHFKVWGKIKNKLVVYTNTEMAIEVRKYREECGLLEKTIIVEINNEFDIEKEIFMRMKSISEDKYFLNYRYIQQACSNNYKYDYIMLMKYWCLNNAVQKKYADGMVAWIDFGYNKGNDYYIKPEEFSFTWETELNEEKIHIFSLNEIKNEKPIFELIRTLEDNIIGGLIVLPSKLCEEFWSLIKRAMNSLLDVGFIDDDQLLILMAYNSKKDIFETHISDWFSPLKEHGAEHLTVKQKKIQKQSFIIKLKKELNEKKRKQDYIRRIKKNL